MQTFANKNVHLLPYFYSSQIINNMMVVDTGSRGPSWIFCLGPQQTVGNGTAQELMGAGPWDHATQMRTPLRDVCPHYAFSKRLNESYSFNAGNVSCASSQE